MIQPPIDASTRDKSRKIFGGLQRGLFKAGLPAGHASPSINGIKAYSGEVAEAGQIDN
jgi:hypothetical protein